MDESRFTNRRNVLKTIGTGVIGSIGLTSSATAKGNRQSNSNENQHGNGNGVGAFLNEKAYAKASPVWDSGIVDKTGQSTVHVDVGAMTSIDTPPNFPNIGPLAFAPKAVKVSPGTEVTWKWLTDHHSVTSYEDPDWGGMFHTRGHKGDTYTRKFSERGNYLYFCIPHGTPFSINLGAPIGEVDNLFGMRGAVIVAGKE
ncbi:MAG: plastocyanin/azurin family copper-binding protein [Halobacteriaceae archaeon]